jgi:NAD(P)-dependent dehydrogenase (short-subunit alcohol dehydrogenase family)
VPDGPRVVLITGSSSGFGRAMVSAFLRGGWSVLATARRAGARRELFAGDLAAHPGRLSVVDLDVTSEAAREATAAIVLGHHRRLDCLVNNAGRAVFGALEDLTPAQVREGVEVNYLGPALLTRALLPALRAARGRVICVSSMFGEQGFALSASYCAGKFALEGFAASLRHEVAPHGVQVALVEPGRHRTAFAQNAGWGEATFAPSSPYREQSFGYAALKSRLAHRPAPAAESVARVVLRLANRKRMPLQVRVGADARVAHALRRILPERAWLRLWDAMCARALRASAETPPATAGELRQA